MTTKWILLSVLAALNAVDIASTWAYIGVYGLSGEVNPLMRAIIANWGLAGLILAKLPTLVVFAMLLRYVAVDVLGFMVAAYTLLGLWHLTVWVLVGS